ncbi:MAG: hypothetical protein ACPGJS_01725 [Flammeovirgaceae bacterium]
MKHYHWLITLLFIITFSACSTYNEHQDVTGIITWKAAEKHTFEVAIEDNTPAYDVLINLRHTPALKLKNFDLKLTITGPDGKAETKDYPLPIRSDSKEMLGSCAGDLCDTETLILAKHQFPEKGTYTFEMTANTEEDIPNMLEIGLIINQAK